MGFSKAELAMSLFRFLVYLARICNAAYQEAEFSDEEPDAPVGPAPVDMDTYLSRVAAQIFHVERGSPESIRNRLNLSLSEVHEYLWKGSRLASEEQRHEWSRYWQRWDPLVSVINGYRFQIQGPPTGQADPGGNPRVRWIAGNSGKMTQVDTGFFVRASR